MNCGVSRRGHRRKRRRARRRGHRNGAVHRTIHFAEHRLQHVPIGSIAIQTYSNAGEGLCNLTNGLTLSGDSRAIVAAGADLTIVQLIAEGRIGRSQVAIILQCQIIANI